MHSQIIISNIIIHQDGEGRYSINDLHKASGEEQRHRPKYWLDIQQTKELIDAIIKGEITPFNENAQICTFDPVRVMRGCKGGTYVCKELVYAYAMWISAEFMLKVIRAYDAMVTATPTAKTTVDERTPLRDAVNVLVSKRALPYDEAYSLIHQRFAVSSIEDLELETLPTAIEYVHRLALEGELLERQPQIFPLDADLFVQIKGGKTIYIQQAQPGECFMSVESAMETARCAGYVVMKWEELLNLRPAELLEACKTAKQLQQKWTKLVAS
ncbi:KilA-N domain-containing protein [Salmonella enterica subsp. enterica]|nr:KilA-N domain-containing protein [Salmonella enterica subsp. enterica]